MRGTPRPRSVPAAVTPKPATVSGLADGDSPRRCELCRHDELGHRCGELDQGDVGGGAARGVRRLIEARMPRDAAHCDGLSGLENLDACVGGHAMRGGEHEVARQRRAGAQIAARIDHHDDGARRITLRRRRLAGNGEGGDWDQQRNEGGRKMREHTSRG